MELGEIAFYIFITLIILAFIHQGYLKITKEEREYNQKINERLKDEFIYDPETGTKLTLEQAESGHWIPHNNANRIKDSDEIEQFYYGDEKEVEELKNYIKKTGYTNKKLTNSQVDLLGKTETLSKYDNWSY